MTLDFIKSLTIFKGISEKEILSINTTHQQYKKNSLVIMHGDVCNKIGIVEFGKLHITKTDINGNEVLLTEVNTGELFYEAFAFSSLPSAVDVYAAAESSVIWIDRKDIMGQLACNMLTVFARRNVFLTERIECLSQRSLREKILSYLYSICSEHGKKFSIPFDRQQLADYLACDRSALSNVLSKLREEGIIEYRKNQFTII